MEISIQEKDKFIANLLTPISKVSDTAVININNHNVNCLCSSTNNDALYANYNIGQTNTQATLNIPDVKKLIKLLNCIDSGDIVLTINNNNLEYKSLKVRFKYHLLEDGIIKVPDIKFTKVENLGYNAEFNVTYEAFNEVHKLSSVITDSNKVYFYTENNKVHAELTDKTRPNIDSYSTIIAEKYDGDEFNKLPISMDALRLMHINKQNNINVKINIARGVFLFETGSLKYLTAAMIH